MYYLIDWNAPLGERLVKKSKNYNKVVSEEELYMDWHDDARTIIYDDTKLKDFEKLKKLKEYKFL